MNQLNSMVHRVRNQMLRFVTLNFWAGCTLVYTCLKVTLGRMHTCVQGVCVHKCARCTLVYASLVRICHHLLPICWPVALLSVQITHVWIVATQPVALLSIQITHVWNPPPCLMARMVCLVPLVMSFLELPLEEPLGRPTWGNMSQNWSCRNFLRDLQGIDL